MTFKQKYIHEKGPFPFNFEQERSEMFQKIINLLQQYDRNMWTVTAFNFGSMLQSYKQVYGFTSLQLETILTLLANIFYEESQSSVQPRLIILKLLNRLLEEQIEITTNFRISNEKLMGIIVDRIKNGTKDSLKHQDTYMEELSKFIVQVSQYGEDYTKEAMEKSIQQKSNKILALFIGSIKSQQRADQIIGQLLKDCSLWERDVSWFFIVSQVAKRFPKLDFSSHYVTIFQQIIKNFTTFLYPTTNEELKKLIDTQPCIGVRPILKSMACLLVNLLIPNSYPQSNYVWNAVQRIFNIIRTTLDHINEPVFIYEQLHFMRAFVKYFLLRYRKERKIFIQKNEDYVEDFHQQPQKQLFVDTWLHNNFNNLWPQIIPKILFYEENDSMSAKIIVDLAMFDHQFFMPLIISAMKNVLLRDDLSMISIYSTKMSILFLFDYIFKDQKQYIFQLLQIFKILIEIVQKLGVSQNLDILELVFRGFLYMDNETLNQPQVQSIIEDSLQIILKNLDSMSISLQENQNQQSELYIDLANIYFPFLIRLDEKTLKKFMDKFTFKILNELPEHTQAYELLSIVCGYISPKFTQQVFKNIYNKLITTQQHQSGAKNKKLNSKQSKHHPHQKQKNKSSYFFFQNIKQTLSTNNQNHVKWYTQLIQCLYQYHPQNIIRDFNQIEKIIICLFKQWDNSTFLEIALDIIFNLILCLCHVHFDWREFNKPQNNSYKTLNIKWQTGTPESVQLLVYIYNKYFVTLMQFMKNRYGDKVSQMETNQKVQYTVNQKKYTLNFKDLRLVDSLLIPQTNQNLQHLEQKKLIYKVFSIQYTVLSALMVRCPFYPGAQLKNNSFYDDNAFKQIRKTARQYGEWICSLMQYYNILWEPNNLKLFNYYWRQSMDEVFFTLPLNSTVQKLSPYYYSQVYRKKELLRCSYLILNQCYVLFTARMQFILESNPVAYMNNPDYLKKHVIFGLNHQFQATLHSFVPPEAEIHQNHRHLMLICKYHIDSSNKNSYSYKYMNSTEKREKQKYLVALKMILANIKKSQNPINYQCCIKDDFILDCLISSVQLFKVFQNKIDKMLSIDLFYLMMVFGFDCNLIGQNRKTDLKKFFDIASQVNGNKQIYQKQFLCSMKQMIKISFTQAQINHIEEEQPSEQINLKLRRTSSFRSPQHISCQAIQKIQTLINHILAKLNVQKSLLDKDAIVYCVFMIMFSKYLLLSNPLFDRITKTLIELTKSEIVQLFDISKTGLFHIINRFNSLKKTSNQIDNQIVKRDYEDFLVLRYLGGQPSSPKDYQYYRKVLIDKSDNYFYPAKKLLFYEYQPLGDDPDSDAWSNQQVLLSFLTSHSELKAFIVSCSHDKDLKEQQTQIDNSMFDENTMGIAANGHKLLNYILDSNPKKNDIFSPFIQNFSIYPVSFYPRMLRKLIRMGNQSTITNLIEIAQQLRQSNQIQQRKMALYISCEIVFVTPIQDKFTKNFIDYLATCSNEIFDFSTQCIFLMFMRNFVISRKIYQAFIKRFRQEKGSSRLRHLTLMNLFLLAQGRFSRQVAIEGIKHLMNGIEEGSNEVSEVIITMICNCFVIAINLKQIGPWINDGLQSLISQKKIYKLNEYIGYQIDQSLKNILAQIVAKTKTEKNMESKNLKIYSKIANKILSSISVYRYNQSFYQVLKDLIFYVVEKVPEEGQTDEEIILQLKDSEYPENIYFQLVNRLKNMVDDPQSVIKKKLKYLESLVINYSYSMNKIQFPEQLLTINEKVMSMDFIISLSNMYCFMSRKEATERVEKEMAKRDKNIYNLMSLLFSTGVREYEWKEEVLKQILKSKKLKIVKQFISLWWKGKNPESQEQKVLQNLVQGVENPYSYFA